MKVFPATNETNAHPFYGGVRMVLRTGGGPTDPDRDLPISNLRVFVLRFALPISSRESPFSEGSSLSGNRISGMESSVRGNERKQSYEMHNNSRCRGSGGPYHGWICHRQRSSWREITWDG